LFVREFPVPLLFRIWDLYFSYPLRITATHVYMCAAVLNSLSEKLTGRSRMDFVIEIHKLDPDSWTQEELEVILAQAYVYERMFAGAPAHLRPARIPKR
jgi:hypothetical protein